MSTVSTGDPRTPLFGALDWYTSLVAGVRDGQLDDPTPCGDFSVRELLTHMSTVLDKLVAFGLEHRDPYFGVELTAEQRSALLTERAAEVVDGRTAARRAEWVAGRVRDVRSAWTDDVLGTDIQLGWGPILPGALVAGTYVMEVLAHGWDLATASGQPSEAPREVAEAGLAGALAGFPAEPRGIAHGVPFEAVVASAPDAGPTERLANWTGRASR